MKKSESFSHTPQNLSVWTKVLRGGTSVDEADSAVYEGDCFSPSSDTVMLDTSSGFFR